MDNDRVMAATQTGTVEILASRIYRQGETDVLVPPGVYPVYHEGGAYYWVMTGKRSHVHVQGPTDLGGGMFTLKCWDKASGPAVEVRSEVLSSREFAALLAEPLCTQGNPEQRLRFTLDLGNSHQPIRRAHMMDNGSVRDD